MTRPSSRRLSLDDMHATAAERGGRCLSLAYAHSQRKLEWECALGHRWFANGGQVRGGSWCPICARKNQNTQHRYTIATLKSIATARGGLCLSARYLGSHSKHRWRCKDGHEWEATASSIIEGSWCPECAANAQRLNIEDVRRFADKHGLRCLSKHCQSNQDRLRWSCPKGHQWEATQNYLSSRPHCPVCREEKRDIKNLARCREIARKRGGECLSDSFLSVPQKMRWRCKDGHEFLATHSQIKAGGWCSECGLKQRRLGIERMREIARERGGRCLSEDYRNQTQPLHWRCAKGHEWKASYSSIRLKSWCPECAREVRTGRVTATIGDMRRWAKERGGWCLSFHYRNNRQTLLWECRKGHRFTIPWQRAREGIWCPQCKAEGILQAQRRKEGDHIGQTDGYLAAARYLADCHGGVCHSREYHGNRAKLQFECADGHRWTSNYYRLRRGSWCPVCSKTQGQKSRRFRQGILSLDDEDELTHYASAIGCEWVGHTMVKLGRNHFFTCASGHLWESDDSQSRGICWCPDCGRMGTALGKTRIVR